ncbi:MAG: ABC transporter ATP-binding protein [Burkholderiaceae bacterium]
MNTGAKLHIQNLSLAYGKTEVLKGVNLSIEPGEFFAFLGPSGSGKSTLLRAIAGFGPKPSGEITIDGEDISGLSPWQRDVGMVFQNYALWPHLTVRENVRFGLQEKRRLRGAEVDERVDRVLELVGMLSYADRRPSQLSGGQQQRIALARTLVVEPRVLLLDEPLSNLDASLRVQVRTEIRALQQKLGITTIFVTHDQEEANTCSDRMAVLQSGVVQQVGSPMALYDAPQNVFVAGFLGTANVISGEVRSEGQGHVFFANGLSFAVPQVPSGARFAVIRPQDIDLAPLSSSEAPVNSIGQCVGQVERKEFLGGLVRYTVRAADHQMMTVDKLHKTGDAVSQVGDRVVLTMPLQGVTLLVA